MPVGGLEVKALWQVNEYTIYFDTDGGSLVESITAFYGEEIVKPSDPTKAEYTFIGWDKEIPLKMPAGGLEVKALWQINEYIISYNDNGNIVLEETYTYKDEVILPTLDNRPGLVFIGWCDNFELTGEIITKVSVGSTGNLSKCRMCR